jgi:hypothetical protein
MIPHISRLVHRWLGHETYGFEAMLDKQTMLEEDGDIYERMTQGGITNVRPMQIYNDVDDEEVTRNLAEAASFPCLVVTCDNIVRHTVERMRKQAELEVAVTVALLGQNEWGTTMRQFSAYALGAVIDSLFCFNEPRLSTPGGYRSIADVSLVELADLDELRIGGGVPFEQLYGAIITRGRYRRTFHGRVP